MRRLGTVVRTRGDVLVVRAAAGDPPDIGTMAIDESLETVGRVVDVFGPTEHPYLAVSPIDSIAAASLLQDTLYWRPD
ncbi:MAG: H/ACA ribonucleoprotein complex subunit GAR1 [Halodesulfurarchaeum sp.]